MLYSDQDTVCFYVDSPAVNFNHSVNLTLSFKVEYLKSSAAKSYESESKKGFIIMKIVNTEDFLNKIRNVDYYNDVLIYLLKGDDDQKYLKMFMKKQADQSDVVRTGTYKSVIEIINDRTKLPDLEIDKGVKL